jgi:transmembrane sensor
MPSIDDQAADWVARRSAGCSPDEEHAFQAWYAADRRHQGAFLRAEAAWTLLDRAQILTHGQLAQGKASATDIALQVLEPPAPLLTDRVPARHKRTRRAVVGGAIAAAAGAAAIATAYSLSRRLSLTTGRGELRNVPLADRSVATINTDSQIDVDMSAQLRHVQLVKGEAWFEVAKNPDAPFVVSAGDVRVRAVGTAFSVRRHDAGADVLVTEGVVEAWNVKDNTKKVSLTAGAVAFVPNAPTRAQVAMQPLDVDRKLAWRTREIILQRDSLSSAVAEFNRYNDRQIVIADPALDKAQLVGGFAVDQPEIFARAVHATLNVPVTIEDTRITIGTSPTAG